MNGLNLAMLAAASALAAWAAAAQPPPPGSEAVQIKATDLGHRTWMLEGQGGNITVIAGDDGVIMVDSQFAPLHDKIKAAVAKLSPQPIRYVVNTHFHGDHTGGNQGFWLDGATVVAQTNLAKSMAKSTTNPVTGAVIPASPRGAQPGRTYGARMTLSVRGRSAELVHMPKAHTGGDTAVWLRDAGVLAAGDIVSVGARYPFVDWGDGGGIDGIISAIDAFLKRADGRTKIVPGHGPLMSRADLVAYRVLMVDARAAVAKLKASGMSEEQVVAAKPLAADVQGRAGATDAQSAIFTRAIYRSLG
ncbi:MAG TPA: MBL fold metallo-hydrolase [Phenylobacterium sp.]|nr:MBL fold metallo-hydrolase [Phenylobacterium sp.]